MELKCLLLPGGLSGVIFSSLREYNEGASGAGSLWKVSNQPVVREVSRRGKDGEAVGWVRKMDKKGRYTHRVTKKV